MKLRAIVATTVLAGMAGMLPGSLIAQRAQTKQTQANQTDDATTKEIRQEFYLVTNDIKLAAAKMPESAYSFRPAPGMRTFGELVFGIADLQSNTCRDTLHLNGKRPTNPVLGNGSKAAIQKALAASFTECYEAFSELSSEDQARVVPASTGMVTRLAALATIIGQYNQGYGSMMVYMRLKDIVPPQTKGKPPVKEVTG